MSSIKSRLKLVHKDSTNEDEILTAMIVSDEFCKGVMPMLDLELLRTPYAQIVSDWCKDYFEQYGKAPKLHVHDLYQAWKSRQHDESTADLLEDFLLRLSSKYEMTEGINAEFVLDKAEKYFKAQRIEAIIDETQSRLQNNDTEGAAQALGSFKDVSKSSLLSQMESAAINSTDFFAMSIKRPKAYVSPFLREGSLTMIYGPKGIGKTWLTYAIALSTTRKNFEDITIGPWMIKRQAGVLILDGEMDQYDIQTRLMQLAAPLGQESTEHPLKIMSSFSFERQPNLTKKEWRDTLSQYLQDHPELKILVLDNIASLAPGIDENVKNEWDPINQWLLSLRKLGVAVLLIHHANKAGFDRGTSGRTDNLDNVIKLTAPNDAKTEDGAFFNVSFEKGRNLRAGEGESFSLRIRPDEQHPTSLVWTTSGESMGSKKHIIMALLLDGKLKPADIAGKLGVGRSYVSQIKSGLAQEGLMDRSGKIAKKGREFMGTIHLEGIYEGMERE